jgi:putative oxidoreductase
MITRYLPFIGRILIGLPFAMSGLSKLAAYGKTTAMIAAAGLPFPPLAFVAAVAVELGGGLLLVLGYQVRPIAFALAASDTAPAQSQGRTVTNSEDSRDEMINENRHRGKSSRKTRDRR